jgi:VanZ family protein
MIRLKHYWRIVFPIAIAPIIWFFSTANGATSESQSMGVANWLGWSNEITRKVAHIVLYLAFGMSLAYYSKGRYPQTYPRYEALIFNMIVVVAYGAIDEVHQLLIAGRNGTFSDVVLDSFAGLCGILLYIAFYCLIWQKIEKRLKSRRKIKNY